MRVPKIVLAIILVSLPIIFVLSLVISTESYQAQDQAGTTVIPTMSVIRESVAAETDTVELSVAQLKTIPKPGEIIEFKLTIKNNSEAAIESLKLENTYNPDRLKPVPEGLIVFFDTNDVTGIISHQNLTEVIGPLESNQEKTLIFRFEIISGSEVCNTYLAEYPEDTTNYEKCFNIDLVPPSTDL